MDDYLGKSCLADIQCTFISAALLLAKQAKYEILILSNVNLFLTILYRFGCC